MNRAMGFGIVSGTMMDNHTLFTVTDHACGDGQQVFATAKILNNSNGTVDEEFLRTDCGQSSTYFYSGIVLEPLTYRKCQNNINSCSDWVDI
jgi:hypothetical protein